MTTERIDVLAVFDGAISVGERFTSLHPDPVAVQNLTTMRAARAAVAELIGAANSALRRAEFEQGADAGNDGMVRRLRAALARAGAA